MSAHCCPEICFVTLHVYCVPPVSIVSRPSSLTADNGSKRTKGVKKKGGSPTEETVFYKWDIGRAYNSEMLYFAVGKITTYERLVPRVNPQHATLITNLNCSQMKQVAACTGQKSGRGNFNIIQTDFERPNTSAHMPD